jgi:transposase
VVADARRALGRAARTSFLIVDAQSVKNTDSAEQRGYDGGKLITGIKRHIGVDTNGLPHAIHITTANVNDRAGALAMFTACKENLTHVISILADGNYTGKNFSSAVSASIGASVQISYRRNHSTFAVIPKRWVVERSFAWLDKCRRLWKNCERKLNSSLNMVVLAFLALLLRRS